DRAVFSFDAARHCDHDRPIATPAGNGEAESVGLDLCFASQNHRHHSGRRNEFESSVFRCSSMVTTEWQPNRVGWPSVRSDTRRQPRPVTSFILGITVFTSDNGKSNLKVRPGITVPPRWVTSALNASGLSASLVMGAILLFVHIPYAGQNQNGSRESKGI